MMTRSVLVKRMSATAGALLLSFAPLAALEAQGDTIRYVAEFPNAVHHEARITVTFPQVQANTPLVVRMSRSSPGRYALHEFAKNVYDVSAVDGAGRVLEIERPDPHSWRLVGHDGTVRVSYTLYGDRADGTYAAIDRTHAHLNAPAAFIWADGMESRPVSLRVAPIASTWTVATQLAPTNDRFTFTAPDVQYLLDSPVMVAPHMWRDMQVPGENGEQSIRFALHHTGTAAEFDSYFESTKGVVREATAVFGELPQCDYGTYTVIGAYLPWAYGDGMEHRNSTVLSSSSSLANNAFGLLGTVSHEFIHIWNVERMRPAELEPFDFTRENMTGMLWLAEGFTSYYDQLLITRAGIGDRSRYAARIGGQVNSVVNSPGRKFHSPVEMSRQAPFVDAATSVDAQNRQNTFISYYTWGAAIGLALDLELRALGESRGNKELSLDSYMREMWSVHGKSFVPYTIDDARNVLGRVAGDTAFANGFFRRYITGREAPDYERLLARVGITVEPASPGEAWIGALVLSQSDGKLLFGATPLMGSPLYEAGVDRNAHLVSLGERILSSRADLEAVLASHSPGEVLALVYESRGQRVETTITLRENPTLQSRLFEETGRTPDAATRERRERWLGSRAG